MKGKKIVVFSPHPDDETFGCGGTIAKRSSEGYEVFVILMTDGRHAYSKLFGIDADPTPEELMRTRKAEVKRAMGILGLREENLVFLDFEDGTLEQNEEKVEKEVTKILEGVPPVEVYYAYEKDIHPDHRAASRIVKSSIKKAHLHTKQYEYSISRRYGHLGRLMELLLNRVKHNMVSIDISAFLPLKEEAIKEFVSQVSITSRRQERPVVENLTRFLRNKETFFITR